eukprot:SAG31_NODE_50_length_30520_cov_89.906712_32_plen_79_part_00
MALNLNLVGCLIQLSYMYPREYPNVGIYFKFSNASKWMHKRLWAPVLKRAQSKLGSGLQLRGAECCWGSILMGPSRSS